VCSWQKREDIRVEEASGRMEIADIREETSGPMESNGRCIDELTAV